MKNMTKVLTCATMLILAITTSTAYAGASEATGLAAVFGDEAFAISAGHGDEISLGSIASATGEDVQGYANAFIVGDETGAGAFSSGESGGEYNSIEVGAFAHGIGDVTGYTWAYARD